jgi:dTDP-4-amino-4,6-dideoxygalactose transaminase
MEVTVVDVKFLDLKKQYSILEKEIDEAVKNIFLSSDYIKGFEVKKFEKAFASYCGTSHCISCGNGTDGLTILIKALDLPEKSTVIVPANTFIATAEAVINNGLNILFADIDDDFTISLESVENLISDNVSAVIAVHLYGQPAKMDKLKNICEKHGVHLIEDAAQAHGAEINGIKVGGFGVASVFSFYPGKVLGAAGDAGAIVTNNPVLAEKISLLSDHGRTGKYVHETTGYNSRMDTIQAAVLNVKLKYLDNWIEKRNAVATAYFNYLKNIEELSFPHVRNNIRHSWHLFVIKTQQRAELMKHLKSKNIGFGIHYPLTLPEQPAFKKHFENCRSFKAVSCSPFIMSLPIGEHLEETEIRYVADSLIHFFK